MSVASALAERLFALPPRRCAVSAEERFVAMPDGVRLSTLHLRPHGMPRGDTPTVLLRTPYGVRRFPRQTILLGRLVAERGYHVLLQDVRGRYRSEGRFTPFENEAEDGRATLAWLANEPWFDGRAALVGASYLAYTAWAALAGAPEHVRGIAVTLGASDPYAIFYRGGAFSLATALEWGVGVGERESVPLRGVDLPRGLVHRPVRESDRVALRQTDWFRDWLAHPRRDAFWDRLRAPLPPRPPALLSLAGWYDFFLPSQLADHGAVAARATGETGAAAAPAPPAPRLVVGPWGHGLPARWVRRGRGVGRIGVALREILHFLDVRVRQDGEDPRPPVRLFVLGANRWREESEWPVPGVEELRLFLRGGGRANGLGGDGRLLADPPASGEAADRFLADPERPVPTRGGAMLARGCGAADQRPVEMRDDVLCYTSAPLERDVEVLGAVRAVLHAASSAPDCDVVVKLVDVGLDGLALNVCDGVVRARWREAEDTGKDPAWLAPGEPVRLEIALSPTACRFAAGHRIRLEVASACFPLFDRNPQAREDPASAPPEAFAVAEQTVFHDADRPSHLVLPVG